MANSIKRLDVSDHGKFPFIFFDANIWIALNKYTPADNIPKRIQKYIDFFDAVIQLNILKSDEDVPISARKGVKAPKIIMTSMLLSEIINSYLRQVAMPNFFNGNRNHDFKTEYRNEIYSDYQDKLESLISDILAYKDYFIFINDKFDSIDVEGMLNSLNRDVDFNDLYYYKILKDKDITIVTDDSDFNFDDITILTTNESLLKFGRN